MINEIDNHEDLLEYKIAKKVWDDIHNNDTLTYNTFEDYFFNEIYFKEELNQNKDE